MAIYSYLSCRDCGEALWLGKQVVDDGFWRGDLTAHALGEVVFRFLGRHPGHAISPLDEGDLLEGQIQHEELDGPASQVETMQLSCSCGVAAAVRRDEILLWLAGHFGHTFVVAEWRGAL